MSRPAAHSEDGNLQQMQGLLADHDTYPQSAISKVDDLLPEEITALAEDNAGGHRPSDGLEQVMPQNIEEEESNGLSRHALYCSHFLSTWGQVWNVSLDAAHAMHHATASLPGECDTTSRCHL